LDNTIKIWNLQGELLQTLESHQRAVIAVDFNPIVEGNIKGNTYWLASASWDTSAKIWRIKKEQQQITGVVEVELQGNQEGLGGVNFSPDGQSIVTVSRDRSIKLWQNDGTLLKTLFGHDSAVWQAEFDPQGKTIVSASEDNSVIIWDLKRIDNLDLLAYGCNWVQNYLTHNPNAENPALCTEK